MVPPLNIGIIRDERFLRHQTGLSHPETPQRLSVVHRMLDYDFAASFRERSAEPATLEQVEALHTPDYVRMVIATARRRFTNLAADTTASSESCFTSFLAAGACIRGRGSSWPETIRRPWPWCAHRDTMPSRPRPRVFVSSTTWASPPWSWCAGGSSACSSWTGTCTTATGCKRSFTNPPRCSTSPATTCTPTPTPETGRRPGPGPARATP